MTRIQSLGSISPLIGIAFMIVGGSFQGTRTNGTVFVVEIARNISTTLV